jgi:K+-sensing histidine kinase KdpD
MTRLADIGRLTFGLVTTVVDSARRYAIAIVAVATTVLVKFAVDGLGNDHPFVLLPVPVAVAAWYGGRGPGLLAVLLVAIAGTAFVGRSLFDDGGDVIALTVVVIEGVIVVGITAGLRSALRRAEESTATAEAARRELRFAVAVRDEVLRVWTEKVRGPLARLEVTATDALHALERDGYHGPATQRLRSLLEDAGVLRRVTASWSESSFPAKTEET